MVNTYPEGMPINVATLNKSPMVTDLLSLETGGSPPHLVGSVPASPGPRHKFKPQGTYVQQNLSKIDVTKMLLA